MSVLLSLVLLASRDETTIFFLILNFIFLINFCQEPAREIPPMTRSCGRELLSKASGLKGLPKLLEHLPQNQNLSVLIFCAFHQLSCHTVAIPNHLSLEKINLGLQLISLLDMRGIFQIKPNCQHSSLLGRFIQTFAATHMIIRSLSTVRGTGSLKHRAFRRVKSYQSSAGLGFHYWANACC